MADNPYESPQARQEARPRPVTNTRRIVAAMALMLVMGAGAYLQWNRGKYVMAIGGLAIAIYALYDTWKTWNSRT